MTIDPDKAVRSLLRTSTVANWVRNNFRRVDKTRDKIRSFVLSPPRHSLSPVYDICAELLYGEISSEDAADKVQNIRQPLTRLSAEEIIPAFERFLLSGTLDPVVEFRNFSLPYPIGRSPSGKQLFILVKPTFVVLENDRLTPYFIIGWANPVLSNYQKRLLSSIINKSILTYQSFIGSDAQIVCFIRIKGTHYRESRQWNARMLSDLTDEDISEQVNRYGQALNLVARELSGD